MKTKNLSLLLATLLGASLTACNSGAGSPTGTSSNQINNAESATTQQVNVGAAGNNIGFVGTDKGELEYYRNDKFIKILHKFEDKVTKVFIPDNRRGGVTLTFYVATEGDHLFGGEVYLNRCVLDVGMIRATCNRIDTYYDTSEDTNLSSSMFFDEQGNGYFMLDPTVGNHTLPTDDNAKYSRLGKYVNNTPVWTKYIKEVDLNDYFALRGPQILEDDNGVIKITHGSEFSSGVASVDTNSNDLKASPVIDDTVNLFGIISLDKDYNGFSIYGGNLYRVINGYRVGASLHEFEDSVEGISTTYFSVYVVTNGKELKKCNYDGNCTTIDKFTNTPKAVAFQTF
jgi:hypothetical protein